MITMGLGKERKREGTNLNGVVEKTKFETCVTALHSTQLELYAFFSFLFFFFLIPVKDAAVALVRTTAKL